MTWCRRSMVRTEHFQFYAKYLKRGHKFCSLSCAVRHNNRFRKNTGEVIG